MSPKEAEILTDRWIEHKKAQGTWCKSPGQAAVIRKWVGTFAADITLPPEARINLEE